MKASWVVVLVLLAACVGGSPKPAPRVSGATFDGGTLELGLPGDAPTLVVFWATWCGVCRQEMPKLVKLLNERPGAVRIVGVNVDTDVSAARRFLDEAPLPYPNVSDPALVVADAFAATATPTLILIDRGGNEIERDHALEPILERLSESAP